MSSSLSRRTLNSILFLPYLEGQGENIQQRSWTLSVTRNIISIVSDNCHKL